MPQRSYAAILSEALVSDHRGRADRVQDESPLALRIGTAAVGLPLLAGIVFLGGAGFSALVAVAAAIGAVEVCQMAANRGYRPATPLAGVWAAAIVGAGHFVAQDESAGVVLASVGGLWVVTGVVWALARLRSVGTMSDWVITAAAAAGTGGPLSYAPLIRELSEGLEWTFLVVLVIFASDTGAFFVGKGIGRHRLAPSVSPNKTWEGAAGGLAAAIAASIGLRYALDLDVGLGLVFALGALIAIAGMAGDLAESRLKRAANVKDSGTILPGHGGLLDRMDSIVPNLVLVYYLLIWAVQ